MKKIINLILVLALLCSAILFTPTEVKAEDLSVSGIPSEMLVGNTFTVKVKVPNNIGGRLYISYPKDNLKFKSGTDGVYGDNGLLNANVFFNSAEISVTFEALSVGTVDFSVYMEEAEYSDKDPSEGLPTIPMITKSIKIVNETKSDDNSLSVLYLSKGYISPDFKSSITTYTTTVDYSVTSVRVTAKTTHAKASIVSVTGNENLKVGENTISIVVKAESGATITYKIIVTREEKKADASEAPDNSENTEKPANKIEGTDSGFDWGGKDLYFTEELPDTSEIKDFKQETVLIDNLIIPCLKHKKIDLVLLNLKNDIDGGRLYVYDEANQYIYPFVKLEANDLYVIALQPDEDIEAPEGYNLCTLSIEGKGSVTAFQYIEDTTSEFYLLYCLNNNGQYNWYQYDSVEKTFQRFTGKAPVEKPQDTETGGEIGEFDDEDDSDTRELKAQIKEAQEKYLKTVCIFVFVLAVLVVVILNLILTRSRKDEDEEVEDAELEEDFDEEEIDEETIDEKEPKEADLEGDLENYTVEDAAEIINKKIIDDKLNAISNEMVDDILVEDISVRLVAEALENSEVEENDAKEVDAKPVVVEEAEAEDVDDEDGDFEFIDL